MLTFIWNPAAASAGWIIVKLSGAVSSDSQQTTIWYQIANSKQIIGGKIHINLKTKLQIATFENADSETDELFLYRLTQRWLFLGVLIPRYLENIFKKHHFHFLIRYHYPTFYNLNISDGDEDKEDFCWGSLSTEHFRGC